MRNNRRRIRRSTATPIPTPPSELAKGVYALVIGTEGAGVSLRAGPGTNNARLDVAPEDGVVLILDGPKADENQEQIVWWFVRGPNGAEGWAAQDFLKPTLPPGTEQQSAPTAEPTAAN